MEAALMDLEVVVVVVVVNMWRRVGGGGGREEGKKESLLRTEFKPVIICNSQELSSNLIFTRIN